MANYFKLKTKNDVSNSSFDLIYTVPSNVMNSVVLGMILTNTVGSQIRASVILTSNTSTYDVSNSSNVIFQNQDITLLNQVAIPPYNALEVFSGQKLNLETYDSISVKSSDPNALDFALSFMEMT